ncbi:peptidase M24 [Desulforamulus reducens MI-1]|uniref:Peptidase M24 n=1 Tax=Desulforamulus reducens (strain ATCC BAA-1160 / DSM 100696 / MI-1) TaxID=349161 RepID=A4J6M7_DESRM|nr:Xaa-Pro peptidase family protein [Desulforamulus reducens]ABO50730.1 peptidase M24 [Desulforamulus reducens MI-1]
MKNRVPFAELKIRMKRFRDKMKATNPDWQMVVIFSKVNIFYFTGTRQDGMLLIPREDEAIYWVRRSYERAMDESFFPHIQPMNTFRDAATSIKHFPSVVYMETEVVPLALYQRFNKNFPFNEVRSVDAQLAAIRGIKSPYELSLMEQSGHIHQLVLEEYVPKMLKEGMSEAKLASELFAVMVEEGHQGVTRVRSTDTEMVLGHIAFGESSIYPSYFYGPGGSYGMSPAVPLLGSRDRKLKKGDLVFIDIGCGVGGYHTDKTMTYMFGESLPKEVISIHNKCVDIQHRTAEMLKPGAIPSEIYRSIMGSLDNGFRKNFMGFGNGVLPFLGHGIGLEIDELPIIAEGFTEPLQEGMVFAVEPKKGIENIGMVGVENTFVVTPQGGRCITGDHPGLIPIY